MTDARGAFRIAGVPPGTCTLRLWHDTLGEITQPISAAAGLTQVSAEYTSIPR
ncbi:MAG: hypothetical protein ACT4QD_01275 [Acidobacteriota bacterium]